MTENKYGFKTALIFFIFFNVPFTYLCNWRLGVSEYVENSSPA